jgi:hypothetical protein
MLLLVGLNAVYIEVNFTREIDIIYASSTNYTLQILNARFVL